MQNWTSEQIDQIVAPVSDSTRIKHSENSTTRIFCNNCHYQMASISSLEKRKGLVVLTEPSKFFAMENDFNEIKLEKFILNQLIAHSC